MTTTIPTYPAGLFHETALNTAPNTVAVPPLWADFTARARFPIGVQRGCQYEDGTNPAGQLATSWWNRDGALDPLNTASAFAPNIVPYRQTRTRAMPGVNLLTANQATACDAAGFTGPVPSWLGVGNDAGFPVTVAASGTAYQGGQVYQAVVPSGQGAGVTVLVVTSVPVVPSTAYSFSAQVRIPSGTSTATSLQIVWFDQSGNQLSASTVTGTAATPTSGSSTWIALGASGTAPATALSASLRVQIASGSTAASTTWQVDGLQWERSATVTPFQVPGTLGPNLLPRAIATGTASMAAGDSAGSWFAPIIGSVAQATGLAAAPTGQTAAVAWTSPAGTTSASPLYAGVVAAGAPAANGPVADCVQVVASQQYTASVYLMRAASADVTVQVTVSIRWFTAAGVLAAANTGSAVTVAAGSWVRGTVTAAAPSNAVWGRARIQISSPAPTTATNVVYAAGWQMEQAAAAAAWTDPGPTLFAYSGLVERWPQGWQASGSYGRIDITGVDAEAALAQYKILDPFIEDVLALGTGPNFVYPLNDGTGSASCADASGKRPPAPVENGPFGAGGLTFGNSVTSATVGRAFIGTAGPVATFNNNPSQNPPANQVAETFVSLHKATVTPGPPTSGGWTRMVAFRAPAAPGTNRGFTLWDANPGFWTANASLVSFAFDNNGFANIQWSDSSGAAAWSYGGLANMCDGNWHLLAIGVDPVAGAVIWIDGAVVSTGPAGGNVTGIVTDVLGCSVSAGVQWYDAGLIGDLALAIEYPFLVSNTQMTALYNSWKLADQGESTGARVRRILSWIPWNGPVAIDNGSTTSMGPATDATGNSALTACQNTAITENGNFYVSSAGVVTFKSRASRYNQLTPTFVFGEKQSLGEWPYEDTTFGDDNSHLFNLIPVAQLSTGQTALAQDDASQLAYFPRTMPTRTINVSSFNEAVDASNYLLGQYKAPRVRVANLLLHPSGVPGLFNACLNLEIGTRIRVMRRSGAVVDQIDCFVEQIAWYIDPTPGGGGKATVKLQCSPADLASYWLLAATHTTLNAQATSGTATATINALPDSAVNALASSLPQGYQLAFEPGTPRAETMTLTATGIPATNVGYSTAVLTFTSNFAFTHAAGATVCEPLPVNVSDPTTWDAVSTLGAASCQVVSGGGSGTATITVGPLGDAKANALGSDWNTGDLLWISPGTAAFEGYNLLTPNQSTAGEGAIPLAAGTTGAGVGVTGALGNPTVTASGTAFQGANVWAVAVAGGAGVPNALTSVLKVPVTALLAHTWSAYARSATTGQNPTVNAYIKYLDASGASLGQTNGSGATLTGAPTAAWTRLTVTATAPAGAVWAQVGVTLTAAPAGAWSWQCDGLQLEQAGSASAYCTTPQVKSVAASVPGYTSVTVTLNSNLINSHAAGDYVCDPLPAGDTTPAQAVGTARLAY